MIIENRTVYFRVYGILLTYLNAVDLAKLPVSHTPNGRTINVAKIISSIIPAFTGLTEENLSKGLLAEVRTRDFQNTK